MSQVRVEIVLDRDKVLDEAIFLAICGLSHCRENSKLTGVVRLEIAKHKLDKTITHINQEFKAKHSKPTIRPLNREEVYKKLVRRYILRESFKRRFPTEQDMEKIRREANIYAVKNTNYCYLNQDKITDLRGGCDER